MRWLWLLSCLVVVFASADARAAEMPQDSVWEAPKQTPVPPPPPAIPAATQPPVDGEAMELARPRLARAKVLLGVGAGLTYGGVGLAVVSAYLGGTLLAGPGWGYVALASLPMALAGPGVMLAAAKTARMALGRTWTTREKLAAVLYGIGLGLTPIGSFAFVAGFLGVFGGAAWSPFALLLGVAGVLGGLACLVTGAIFAHIAGRREIRITQRRLAVVPWHQRDGESTGLALVGAF